MSFSEFARPLSEDGKCRAYFDKVFCYLRDVADGKNTGQVSEMDKALKRVMVFLKQHAQHEAWMQLGVNKIDLINV